ncbi:hypothetical protein ACP4OV_017721 [Aristida adscensionis]
MVRRHGWQLPAHTLQIVAITVFFLLVVAFYAFFAPFLGKQVLEYVAIGIYTPVAFAVFILYIRCTSINPADPAIMSKFEDGFIDAPASTAGLQCTDLPTKDDVASGTNSPTSSCRSSLNEHSHHGGLAVGDANTNLSSQPPIRSSRSCLLGGIICALFVKGDCRKFDDSENQVEGEDALFCTLCNAEVHKFSKHCRSCDKCVDGFDHHCRWLNNCVGRKNYFTFIALMIASLLWLVIEFGVGIAVLVLCFVNKNAERIIQDKLVNGLTLPPFATIVAIFTLLSLVACISLGELFFFHMILIQKGITTYEYVVAMRAMSEAPQEEEEEGVNIVYSPTNSATTGFSGASSLGVHHKGAWCTPPRIFVDQDEVIPFPHLDSGMAPSTINPDGHAERTNGKAKKQVKISAWKLAKLDGNEAMRAAARARASSSVLRPVDARRRPDAAELSSLSNGSSGGDRSASATMEKGVATTLSSLQSSYPQSLAATHDDEDDDDEEEESGTPSASTMSSPVHIHHKAIAPHSDDHQCGATCCSTTSKACAGVGDGEAAAAAAAACSGGADEQADVPVGDVVCPGEPEGLGGLGSRAGGGVDQPATARTPRFLANPGGAASNRGRVLAPVNASSSTLPSGQPPERPAYAGPSIFYGGPRLGAAAAAADPGRDEASTGVRQGELNGHRHGHGVGGERRRTAQALPVFAPGTFLKNPPFSR